MWSQRYESCFIYSMFNLRRQLEEAIHSILSCKEEKAHTNVGPQVVANFAEESRTEVRTSTSFGWL